MQMSGFRDADPEFPNFVSLSKNSSVPSYCRGESVLAGFLRLTEASSVFRGPRVFRGHGVSVVGCDFTSDGQLVTLDHNAQMRRWNLESQREDEASRRDLPRGPVAVKDLIESGPANNPPHPAAGHLLPLAVC